MPNLVEIDIRASDMTGPGFAGVLGRVSALKKAVADAGTMKINVIGTSLDEALAKVEELKKASADDSGNIIMGTADVDAALAKVEALKKAVGEDSGQVIIGTSGLDSALSSIKAKLAAHGIADLLDVNLNQGQIDQQLLLLKRKIDQAKVTDLLDFNVNTSEVSGQLGSLAAKFADTTIPLKLGLDTSGINLADLPKLGPTQSLNVGGGVSSATLASLTDAQAKLGDLDTALKALDQQFLAMAQAGAADDDTLGHLSGTLEGLYMQVEDVEKALEAASSGGIADSAKQLGVLSQMLDDLDANLASTGDAVHTAGAPFFALQQAADAAGVGVDDLGAKLNQMDGIVAGALGRLDNAAADIAAMGAAAGGAAGSGGGGGFTGLAAAAAAAGDAGDGANSKLRGLLATQLATVPVLAGAGRGWMGLARDVTLFGGALGSTAMIGSVKLWHLALDGVLETTIALGAGLASLTIGVASMVPAAQDIYTHLKAVQSVNSALGTSIPPLTGQFQALAQAMAPQTIEAYGGALNLLNNNSGVFARTAHEVVTGIDDVVAKLDLWSAAQSHSGALLQSGVSFLHQFAEMAGNVFLAIDNLVRADPGTAHFLMDLVVGASKALEVFTSLPTPVLLGGQAIHSFILWGGLLTTWATNIGITLINAGQGAIRLAAGFGLLGDAGKAALIPLNDLRTAEAGAALESSSFSTKLAALATNPLAWATVAAAGIAYLGYEMSQTSAVAKTFISNLESQISGTDPSQLFSAISGGIGSLDQQITATMPKIDGAFTPFNDALRTSGQNLEGAFHNIPGITTSITNWSTGLKDSVGFVEGLGKAAADFFPNLIVSSQASNSVSAYRGEIVKLTGEQDNLFREMGGLVQQGYSVQQSLALMDMAGVKAGDSFDLMRQKVTNLVKGYADMGESGGLLTNTVNAVSFASAFQSSQVQQLTQGWDAFLKMVTGGESAFVTFGQQLTAISTAATTTANSLTVSNGKVSVSTKNAGAAAAGAVVSITGLSTASLQLRSSFTQGITDAGNMMDALTNMAAAAGLGTQGTDDLTQAGKDLVAQLLPMAQGSTAATAELYALAQQAGYTGADSFKALAQWVGNVQNPMKNLDGITTQLTVASAGLTADVQNLSTALGTTLNNAMATAIFQATGGQKAFDDFATAVVNSGLDSTQTEQAAIKLGGELMTLLGNTSQAKNEFISLAVDGLHLSYSTAVQLWNNFGSQGKNALQSAGSDADTLRTAHFNPLKQSIFDVTNQVGGLHTSLINLPKNTPVNVNMHATGSGEITAKENILGETQQMIGNLMFVAEGGMVTGGTPGKDSVPIMAMPGEVVVPTAMVNAGAVDNLRGKLPGFAAGGMVGFEQKTGGMPGWTSGIEHGYGKSDLTSFGNAAIDALVKAIQDAAAAKAAAAAASSAHAGPGGGAPAANAALARKLYPQWGSGAEWTAWNNVAMAESGWNQFATNPGSGAYGIPQALPYTKMPKAAWPASAGGSSNPTAQISWMAGYMSQVYHDPIGAWAHEVADHWYGSGGTTSGGWIGVGEHGRELIKVPGGSTVIPNGQAQQMTAYTSAGAPVQVSFELGSTGNTAFDALMLKWVRENVRVKGGGNVQKAFGQAGK